MPITINGTGPIDGITSLNTTVSSTELGYLDGVTSALQTQINTAGGLVKITDNTFSAQSSVSVNNCFTSTYANYRVIINLTATTGSGGYMTIRLRAAGTDATTNYEQNRVESYNTTITSANDPLGTDEWGVGGIHAAASADYFTILDIFSPNIAARTSAFTQNFGASSGETRLTTYSGSRQTSSTQFDGFSILTTGTNMTGSLRVYGYRN